MAEGSEGAKLYVSVSAEIADLKRGLSQAKASIKDFQSSQSSAMREGDRAWRSAGAGARAYGQQVQSVQQNADRGWSRVGSSVQRHLVRGVAVGAGVIAGTLVTAIGASARESQKLELGLRKVNSLTGLTGRAGSRSFQSFRNDITKLSVELGVAQTTLTDGLYQAISAGVPRGNAVDFMRVATKAAIAGITDTDTAVDGLSTSLNAFKDQNLTAQRAADILFQTVNLGKTEFPALAHNIGKAAPLVDTAGVAFADFGAAIATMTSKGISTSETMTSIKGAMIGVLRPTSDMEKAYKRLGVSGWDELLKRSGSMQSAFQVIRDAAKGNKDELIRMVGSIDAANAILSLTGPNAGDAAKHLAGVKDSAGAANKAFNELNRSGMRQMEQAGVQAKNIGMMFVNEFMPDVTRALSSVAKSLQSDMANPAFHEQVHQLATDTRDFVSAVASGVGVIADHAGEVKALAVSLLTLGATFKILSGVRAVGSFFNVASRGAGLFAAEGAAAAVSAKAMGGGARFIVGSTGKVVDTTTRSARAMKFLGTAMGLVPFGPWGLAAAGVAAAAGGVYLYMHRAGDSARDFTKDLQANQTALDAVSASMDRRDRQRARGGGKGPQAHAQGVVDKGTATGIALKSEAELYDLQKRRAELQHKLSDDQARGDVYLGAKQSLREATSDQQKLIADYNEFLTGNKRDLGDDSPFSKAFGTMSDQEGAKKFLDLMGQSDERIGKAKGQIASYRAEIEKLDKLLDKYEAQARAARAAAGKDTTSDHTVNAMRTTGALRGVVATPKIAGGQDPLNRWLANFNDDLDSAKRGSMTEAQYINSRLKQVGFVQASKEWADYHRRQLALARGATIVGTAGMNAILSNVGAVSNVGGMFLSALRNALNVAGGMLGGWHFPTIHIPILGDLHMPKAPTKGRAKGDIVRGPGTGTSDSILSWVSNGEAVIPAVSVNANRGATEWMIDHPGSQLPGFAKGKKATDTKYDKADKAWGGLKDRWGAREAADDKALARAERTGKTKKDKTGKKDDIAALQKQIKTFRAEAAAMQRFENAHKGALTAGTKGDIDSSIASALRSITSTRQALADLKAPDKESADTQTANEKALEDFQKDVRLGKYSGGTTEGALAVQAASANLTRDQADDNVARQAQFDYYAQAAKATQDFIAHHALSPDELDQANEVLAGYLDKQSQFAAPEYDQTADTQAQLEQSNRRASIAQDAAAIAQAQFAVLSGSNDIGEARGGNAVQSAQSLTMVFPSAVPYTGDQAAQVSQMAARGNDRRGVQRRATPGVIKLAGV